MALAVYTKACEKNVAGNQAVLITEADNISSVTVAAGEVTAITMNASATFKQIEPNLDGILRTEEGTGNDSNIGFVHRVEMIFAKPCLELNTLRDSLADASPCGMVAIVLDGNGVSWLVGYNETDGLQRPLYLQQDNMNSGNSPLDEDVQNVTVALEASSGYEDLPLDSSLTASIVSAIAAGGGSAIEWEPQYGADLIRDGDMSSLANWTDPGSDVAIVSGAAEVTATTTSSVRFMQEFLTPLTAGLTYRLWFDLYVPTGNTDSEGMKTALFDGTHGTEYFSYKNTVANDAWESFYVDIIPVNSVEGIAFYHCDSIGGTASITIGDIVRIDNVVMKLKNY